MKTQLKVGGIYTVTTAGGRKATCLHNLPNGRALFLVSGMVSPFVSWEYSLTGATNLSYIQCFHGNYYSDLAEALKAEGVKL